MTTSISADNLSKRYKLGLTHSGSVREAVSRAWSRLSRKHPSVSPALTGHHSDRIEDGHFWALRNVSFEIQSGEVIGFIGRNGAGKSTLLKLLSRITRPSEGRAVIWGRVASLLEVGTGFHPELTGRENVFLNATMLGMTKTEVQKQFDSIVDFAGVETFIDTPVKRYSSGMTVRLGFAVAAHLQPEVLIVDEVLAVGDAAFQEKCLGKMSELGAEGRTIIFVSHSMPAIEKLTRKCFVISDGECVFEGPSGEAVDHYLNRQKGVPGGSIEVSELPRVSWVGDRSISFSTAELIVGSNQALKADGDITLRLGMEAREPIPSFWFGVTLCYRDGTPVGSSFSEPLGPVEAGESVLSEMTVSNPGLAPGHYFFTLGALRRHGEVTDVIHEVLHFDVDAPQFLPAGFAEWNAGWGRLRLKMSSVLCTTLVRRDVPTPAK